MWPNSVQPQTENVEIEFDRKTSAVTLKCEEKGASIVYKTNPDDKSWLLYTTPFKVAKGTQVAAAAIRYGYKQSAESVLIVP
jgi:hypothetical protein